MDKDKIYPQIRITEENVGKGKRKLHPNSLANLKPLHSKEHLIKMQKMGVKASAEARIKRTAMKKTIRELRMISDDIMGDMPTGLEVLKITMMQAIVDKDLIEASRLAAIISEYEQPKLQRTETINKNYDFKDLTDEELKEEMAKLDKPQETLKLENNDELESDDTSLTDKKTQL